MAAELSPAARQNISDEYTAKIPNLLERVKEYTGEEYEFVVDFNELCAHIDKGDIDHVGTIAYKVYESFVDELKLITQEGEDQWARNYFNTVISTRQIKFDNEDTDEVYRENKGGTSRCWCRINDNIPGFVFGTEYFGLTGWDSKAWAMLEEELDKAFAQTNKGQLPLVAWMRFRNDFLADKDRLETELARGLLGNKVALVVSPEQIWQAMWKELDELKRNDQEYIKSISKCMGSLIYNIFSGCLDQIRNQLEGDKETIDLFLEVCPRKELRFKLATYGLTRRDYDAVFEDDAFVVRTFPGYWLEAVSRGSVCTDRICSGVENLHQLLLNDGPY